MCFLSFKYCSNPPWEIWRSPVATGFLRRGILLNTFGWKLILSFWANVQSGTIHGVTGQLFVSLQDCGFMGTSQDQQWAEEMLEGCPPTQPGHTLPPCVSAHRQLGGPGPCCSCLLSFSDPSFQSFISQAPSDYPTGWPEVKSWFPWFMPLHSLLQFYHHLLRVQLCTTYPQIPLPLGTSCCFLNFHIISGISGWSHMTELATVERTRVKRASTRSIRVFCSKLQTLCIPPQCIHHASEI